MLMLPEIGLPALVTLVPDRLKNTASSNSLSGVIENLGGNASLC